MGLLTKLVYGNKRYFKARVQCNDLLHKNVKLIAIDKSDKAEELAKQAAERALPAKDCPKCMVILDEITLDEFKAAKKMYDVIEV